MGDQTQRDWLPFIQSLGTGVYAVRAVTPDRYRYEYVSNVSYRTFQASMAEERGVVAHQWVPHVIAMESDVRDADCGEDLPCDPSEKWCVIPGCLCLDGICGRKEDA
jgi:hypothetical protein